MSLAAWHNFSGWCSPQAGEKEEWTWRGTKEDISNLISQISNNTGATS
jgi:hypothetical protein